MILRALEAYADYRLLNLCIVGGYFTLTTIDLPLYIFVCLKITVIYCFVVFIMNLVFKTKKSILGVFLSRLRLYMNFCNIKEKGYGSNIVHDIYSDFDL